MGLRYLDEPAASGGLRYLDETPQQSPPTSREDIAKQILDEDYGTVGRFMVGLGGALTKGYEGVKGLLPGQESDQDVADWASAAEKASTAANVGGIAGEVLKYAPTMALPGGVVAQALGSAALGAAYDPTGKRLESGMVEGAMGGAGAAIGKALPVVAGKAANVYDQFIGQRGQPAMYGSLDRARAALQQIFGGQSDDAARALQEAVDRGRDVSTAQALYGVKDAGRRAAVLDDIMAGKTGLGAGDMLASEAQKANQLARQELQRRATMANLAGGATSEESAQYIKQFMKQAEAELGPKRSIYLAQLAYGGDEARRLLPQLSELEQRYVNALRQGMPFSGAPTRTATVAPEILARDGQSVVHPATEAAQSGVRFQAGAPGWISNADRAVEWGGAAKEFGDIAAETRVAADALRQQISELPSAFTAAPVRDAVASMANSTVNPVQKTVLERVGKALEIAGDDPVKIAEVRKLGVNQLMSDLLESGTLPKGDAAAALKQVKKAIDKQLGPDMVENYFKPYAEKLAYRDSLEAMDELRRMQAKNPKEFMRTIAGDNPKFLEKYGVNSINELMGAERAGTLRSVSGTMERDAGMKESMKGAKATASALEDVLSESGWKARLPSVLNRYVVVANEALAKGEMKMNKEMYSIINKAMRDPNEMLKLLKLLPPEQRNKMVGFMNNVGKLGTSAGAAYGEEYRK